MQDNYFPIHNLHQDVLLEYSTGLNLGRILPTESKYREYCRFKVMGHCFL